MKVMIAGLVTLCAYAGMARAEKEEIAYNDKTYGACTVLSIIRPTTHEHGLFCKDSSQGPEELLAFLCSISTKWPQPARDDEAMPNVAFSVFLTIPSVPDGMNLIAHETSPYPLVSIEMGTTALPALALNWGFNPKQLDGQAEKFQFTMLGEGSLYPLVLLNEEANGERVLSYRIDEEVGHILFSSDVSKAVDDYIARCAKMGRVEWEEGKAKE